MYLKKLKRGAMLIEVLLSMVISSFMMSAIFGLLVSTLRHKQFYEDVFNEFQKSTRIRTTIESRIVNVGLGIPSGEDLENLFRFPSSSTLILHGWTDALEILTINNIPAPFQDVGGEQVSRGEHMRVLSTMNAASDIRIVPAGVEWGPFETKTICIRKPHNKSVSYNSVAGELSSWITTPSFGRPIVIRSLTAPYASNSGSIELQNPSPVSRDWHGVDMFHSFRISYFFVEVETFRIMDSNSRDNAASLHNEPVVDGVLSACFEFNKTGKTLSCWFLLLSSSPSVKPGIPNGWPEWANTQPNVSSNKMKVVSHSWHLRNI